MQITSQNQQLNKKMISGLPIHQPVHTFYEELSLADQREPLPTAMKDNPLPNSVPKPLTNVSQNQPPKLASEDPKLPNKPVETKDTQPTKILAPVPKQNTQPIDTTPQVPKSNTSKPDLKTNLQPKAPLNEGIAAPRMISKPPVLDGDSIDF